MFPWSDEGRSLHRRRSTNCNQFDDDRRHSILSAWNDEVCSEQLPEVEIFSLLEEQIPRYCLRADSLTTFGGYENQDWFIPAPALKPEEQDIPLTPDQIRETLNYFVLCSERVSQMNKTYNDIEAVTRLLEEKEKDLELTARIGKELLSHNNKLEARVASLEAELKTAHDKIEQISYDLIKKTELIQVLTNDTEESGSEAGTPTALRCINVELMQRRVKLLEDENKALKKEFTQLAHETEHCEEQEQQLVKDITKQLANANCEVLGIQEDLEKQREENRTQYEHIVSLTGRLGDTEAKLKRVSEEYEESLTVLQITKENQNSLAQELCEMKDRYAEVLALLQDVQEDLKKQKKKSMPSVRGGLLSCPSFPAPPGDSLASELESSLYSELSLDSGISADRPPFKRIFETVKCANQPAQLAYAQTLQTATVSTTGPRISSRPIPKSDTVISNTEIDNIPYENVIQYPIDPITPLPNVPGSCELAEALRKLTPGDVTARRAALGDTPSGYPYPYGDYDGFVLPLGCRTPDSIMSTGSSGYFGGGPPSNRGWRLPERLQIVKPMEGSATLHQWSQLATPTMSGLLEDRPGVKTKGGRALEDIGLELYTLTDVEEDDEFLYPGKSFQQAGTVYTFTDSRVLHPDDRSHAGSVVGSLVGSRVCTGTANSRQSTAPPTPHALTRRNSCSTFSTSSTLAKYLNERTPSAIATPSSTFSPTATPANSPMASARSSPTHSRSPSPQPFNPLRLPGFVVSGAELLKRTFYGSEVGGKKGRERLPRREKKALSDIKLVEKIESIGIETILTATSCITQPTLPGALYSRRALPSPMAQLTQFKTSKSFELAKKQAEVGRQMGRPSGSARQRKTPRGALRSDLGTVESPHTEPAASGGPLGTLSSMLFGRKGGLL